jgi:LacI family transcriptional regulator
VPNALARGLVHQTSPTVGILSDDFSDVAIARFVIGAQRSVAGEGFAALVVSTPAGGDHTVSLRWLHELRVRGVLLIAPSLESDARLAEAFRDSVPRVSLSQVAGTRTTVVGSDHRLTGALVAEHLLSLGHQRVGTITGGRDRRVTLSRLKGFRDRLRAGGVTLEPAGVVEADWTSSGARAAAHRLLDADAEITAIFAQSDLMALGVLRALAERGIRVPGDCSVVGCDDLDIAGFLTPPLTTVRVPFEETGALAAHLLLRSIRGEKIPARELLPVRFVERASTARPPPQSRRSVLSSSPARHV